MTKIKPSTKWITKTKSVVVDVRRKDGSIRPESRTIEYGVRYKSDYDAKRILGKIRQLQRRYSKELFNDIIYELQDDIVTMLWAFVKRYPQFRTQLKTDWETTSILYKDACDVLRALLVDSNKINPDYPLAPGSNHNALLYARLFDQNNGVLFQGLRDRYALRGYGEYKCLECGKITRLRQDDERRCYRCQSHHLKLNSKKSHNLSRVVPDTAMNIATGRRVSLERDPGARKLLARYPNPEEVLLEKERHTPVFKNTTGVDKVDKLVDLMRSLSDREVKILKLMLKFPSIAQRELSDKTGLSKSTINRIVNKIKQST